MQSKNKCLDVDVLKTSGYFSRKESSELKKKSVQWHDANELKTEEAEDPRKLIYEDEEKPGPRVQVKFWSLAYLAHCLVEYCLRTVSIHMQFSQFYSRRCRTDTKLFSGAWCTGNLPRSSSAPFRRNASAADCSNK